MMYPVYTALAVVLFLVMNGVVLGYPAPVVRGTVLSGKEQAIVCACADAFFPRGGVIPMSGSEAGAVSYFATLLSETPFRTRVLLRLLLRFVEHGPWVFNLRPRFTHQTMASRVRTLSSWSNSPFYFLRISFQSLRTLIGMAYLANDEVVARIGAGAHLSPFEKRVA